MKIGIVTYHRTLNYGACLQAVATRVALEKQGHEAYYVDYWPEYHSNIYKLFSLNRFCTIGFPSCLDYLYKSCKNFKFKRARINKFEIFFKQYIYPYCKPVTEEFDIIIYGSDQIWRKQNSRIRYNPVYFAKNDFHTAKNIAFSASMGLLPNDEKDIKNIKNYLQNFDRISVREQNLKEFLSTLGINDTVLTLDPTFLLTNFDWDLVFPLKEDLKEKYVLVYGINSVAFDMMKVKKFAESNGFSIKYIYGGSSQNPCDFIDLIRHAEFVFTSSFHGLAFSIIYQKQFFASYVNNSNRAETILSTLGINNRILKPNSDIPNNIGIIDYNKVNEKLETARSQSLSFLKNTIKYK